MTDVAEAIEGVVALVFGGFILLLIGSAVESSSVLYDISVVGAIMILLAIVLGVAVAATLFGKLVGR
jgi:hypothetical protein